MTTEIHRHQLDHMSRETAKKGAVASSYFVSLSFVVLFALVISSWYFVVVLEGAGLSDLFSDDNWRLGRKFIGQLAGAGTSETPASLDEESWKDALSLSIETLLMSILAIGLATVGMFLTVVPASRTAADGSMTLSRQRLSKVWHYII